LVTATADANKAAIDALESCFHRRFGRQVSRPILHRSAERGWDVARHIADWSRGDDGDEGYLRNFAPGYIPPTGPGLWVPTPPGFQPMPQPSWGANGCLAIPDGSSCSPGEPTPFSHDPDSTFFADATEVYGAVNHLTPEQESTARLWSDDPAVTATPPGHSILIATQVLRAEDASLMTAAKTHARVGIAIRDAVVSCWSTKYRYNLVRPVTYLQRLIDPHWLSPLATPSFPEYTSGHSVQSSAAATVLQTLLGAVEFDDSTNLSIGHPVRRFKSFMEAADEAAVSRLYGGIHYPMAIENGKAQGVCIGRKVLERVQTRQVN
jgi:hypothetical protein